jgi:hypothetical protein
MIERREMTGDTSDISKEPPLMASPPPAAGRWRNILSAIGLTGIVGAAVTTYFQVVSAGYQNRASQIDRDTKKVLTVQRDLGEVVDERWSATYRLVDALNKKVSAEEFKAAKDRFWSANDQWELHYINLSTEVEFYVDGLFGLDIGDKLTPVWQSSGGQGCIAFPFDQERGGADPSTVRVLLEVTNNCHQLLKDELEPIVGDRKADFDRNRRKESDDEIYRRSYLRLHHIWHINDAMRCMIVARALGIRQSASVISLASLSDLLLGMTPTNYNPPDTGYCLDRYRADQKLGAPSVRRDTSSK